MTKLEFSGERRRVDNIISGLTILVPTYFNILLPNGISIKRRD
jgi:hypothetical protein